MTAQQSVQYQGGVSFEEQQRKAQMPQFRAQAIFAAATSLPGASIEDTLARADAFLKWALQDPIVSMVSPLAQFGAAYDS